MTKHEHQHKHMHEHECSACSTANHCGHEHAAYPAEGGCGCGHEHGNGLSRWELSLLGISILLFLLALLPFSAPIQPALLILSVGLAGAKLFLQGLKAGIKLQLDELFLLTVAVVAAIFIGEYFEAAIVTILFRIGELLEERAVQRSKREIEALTAIRPDTAYLQDESGIFSAVDAQRVPIGSNIRIRPGDRVPLDCIVTEGISTVDCSAITGESLPLDVNAGTTLPSSAINGAGLLLCRTTSDFANSSASRIIALVEQSAAKKGQTEKFITRFSRVYTPIVLLLAAALAILPPLLGLGSWQVWLSRCLVFLVASCPCALVISVPLSFFAGIGAASKRGVIIKGSKYIELLAVVDCAVFDKTGTLTDGKLSISGVKAVNGYTEEQVLHIASAAERNSNHPIARAIAAHHDSLPSHNAHCLSDFVEVSGHGISLTLDGEAVLCGSKRFLLENGIALGEIDGMSVYVAVNGAAIGGLQVSDRLRTDAVQTLQSLKSQGVKQTVMLTGDHEQNAEKIAAAVGIDRFFAGLLPEDKVNRLTECKDELGTTLFVGDGINDAPVLAASDIGIAMGFGTDAAIEAADVVLVSDRLSSLSDAITLSKRTLSIARFNILFALMIKAIVLILGAAGLAQMWMAVFADVGVSILAVINSMRILSESNSYKNK